MPYSSPAQRAAVWANRARAEKEREATWDEIITKGPGLTKRDVHNYYMDPVIQQRILAALQGRDLVATMSRSPEKQIVKRYRRQNEPIRINSKDDLEYHAARRYTEFHPTVGRQTQEVWVDIDPGKSVSLEKLKPAVEDVERVVRSLPNVRDSAISFSGGRGFHVRGFLDKPRDTTRMRKKLESELGSILESNRAYTATPPRANQIRLDTSTLHDKGSLRAPYSLNAQTGLVAVPLKREELENFDPIRDATPEAVLKKKEFAPGIPSERVIQPIPEEADKHWTLSVQKHEAKKAGKHFDLRLVDPSTGYAHSWAVPKTKFPEQGGRPILAIQTPTHTADYALRFGAEETQNIPRGYGAGKVRIVEKDPVKILSATPNSVKFQKATGEIFHLFRTKDTAWLLRNTTPATKEGADMSNAYETGYRLTMEKIARHMGMEGKPSTSEIHRPMENNDQGSPADMLATILQDIPELQSKNRRPKSTSLGIQQRLNRRTGWSAPMPMNDTTITGPSPLMVGRW